MYRAAKRETERRKNVIHYDKQLKELQERVSFAEAARALTELYGVYIWSFLYSLRPFYRYTTDRSTSVCGGALLLSLSLFSVCSASCRCLGRVYIWWIYPGRE